MRHILIATAITLTSASVQAASAVVVGGGPVGLATAIEAKQSGFDVTIVEKREDYIRNQTFFLFDSSLELLEKWGLSIPEMKVIDIGEGGKIGLVQIKVLEKYLQKRASDLGIENVHGELVDIYKEDKSIRVSTEGKETDLFYDVLVGADGAYSVTREKLGIDCHHFGEAIAGSAFVPLESKGEIGFSPYSHEENCFIRKIDLGSGSLLFLQSESKEIDDFEEILEKISLKCGWKEEADAIAIGKATMMKDIHVLLQQAVEFSSENYSTILVGDAAATASFLQGMGVNTGFLTAELAGQLFQGIIKEEKEVYKKFDLAMKKTTDLLIKDSEFLFVKH